MDELEAEQCWDANAEAWTTLARLGCDVYRDRVNTPAFMAMLPDVNGLHGLDIGCGEGHNTRLVALRGACMTALDYSEQGNRKELVCGDYFDAEQGRIEHWIFNSAPKEYKRRFPRFQIPRFPRTLSFWINTLLETGFILERIAEPHAEPETARQYPQIADTRIIAYFLILRCRQPVSDE